ncbi:MAG: tetratricopeptide repeat protein [Bacteroidales bacterium]|jgi:TolA-binding protein|nr:tetratricopeptide repeat protein [Bacteroidales bacterium]
MKRKLFWLLMMPAMLGLAQPNAGNRLLLSKLRQAHLLYEKSSYIAAGQLFQAVAAESAPQSNICSEAQFFSGLCAIRENPKTGEALLLQYVKDYPESVWLNRAWFEIGNVRFVAGRFDDMNDAYWKINPRTLSLEDQVTIIYQCGYAWFEVGNYEQAEAEFAKIKDSGRKMANPAKYYWAHIQYMNNRNQEALTAFEQLREDAQYADVAPYYLCQIYYRMGRYDEAVNLANQLSKTADNTQMGGLAKVQAASYFNKGNFAEAIPYFEQYFDKNNLAAQSREDNYMLGYSYYATGQYSKAIAPLSVAAGGRDELAQNANLRIGDSYLHLNAPANARQAFSAAVAIPGNTNARKDAIFNLAKTEYELTYSPQNDNLALFDSFIAQYPDAQSSPDAYTYLADIYMRTTNCQDACMSIEKIVNKTPRIKNAWQRAAYNQGLALVNRQSYQDALVYFDRALSSGGDDTQITAGATYWRAETNYRLGKIDAAYAGFRSFQTMKEAQLMPEYKLLQYNFGYILLKQDKYEQAVEQFKQYLNRTGLQPTTVADATNRIGDCYLLLRDYANASTYYNMAYQMNVHEPDYSLLKIATCQGLQKRNDQKISTLKSLLQNYPQSAYADDAMFELARTYELSNQTTEAASYYESLLTNFPDSEFQPQALLQMGLICYNNSDFDRSLTYYKRIAEKYPNSEEAPSAMLGIKNNYMENNNLDGYLAYAVTVNAAVPATQQDSLRYDVAEKLALANDGRARAQLEQYLSDFPNGGFRTNVHYYLGEIKYKAGEYGAAMADYQFVADDTKSSLAGRALQRLADASYRSGNYVQALAYYKQLTQQSAAVPEQVGLGIVRCNYELHDWQACINAAAPLVAAAGLSVEAKREVTFKLAKSYYAQNNIDRALPLFQGLSAETQSTEGAESKYLLAESLFRQNQLDRAENEIMDFISKDTPHQFWLGQSFILLADVYFNKKDVFQATQTLKSVISNYPVDNDGVIDLAKSKLQYMESQTPQQK